MRSRPRLLFALALVSGLAQAADSFERAARRAHGGRPGAVYCFDRIAETGEPPARR